MAWRLEHHGLLPESSVGGASAHEEIPRVESYGPSCRLSRVLRGAPRQYRGADGEVGPGGNSCRGDLACEGPEDGFNCADDCGAPPVCSDLTCDPGEDQCSCATDCGTPPASEAGACTDGVDNDCDTDVDCADADCDGIDPACLPVDCSTFGDKTSCNAQPECRRDNKNKVCVPN